MIDEVYNIEINLFTKNRSFRFKITPLENKLNVHCIYCFLVNIIYEFDILNICMFREILSSNDFFPFQGYPFSNIPVRNKYKKTLSKEMA